MKKARVALLAKKMARTRRKQARGVLRRASTGAMCALGFACEVFRQETGRGQWRGGEFIVKKHDIKSYGVPDAVLNWYGMTYGDTIQLVSYNDTMKLSFREIAQEIKPHVVR